MPPVCGARRLHAARAIASQPGPVYHGVITPQSPHTTRALWPNPVSRNGAPPQRAGWYTPALPLPPSLTAPCAAPVPLPIRDLSDQEIEVLWGRDRSALRECGSRFTAHNSG